VKARFVSLLVVTAASLTAQYNWDFSQNPIAADPGHWTQNPTVSFGSPTTFSTSGGGSLIYNQTVTGANANDYDLDATLALKSGGGAYVEYLRASQTALLSHSGATETCAGSFIAIEIDVPSSGFSQSGTLATIALYQCSSGTLTQLANTQASVKDGMTTRTVIWSGNLRFFIGGIQVLRSSALTGTSGNPGVGGYNQPSGSGFSGASVGHRDTVAPNPINGQTVGFSALPNQVSMQWAGTVDDLPGIGLYGYLISRGDANGNNMTLLSTSPEPEFADDTAQANTTYTYQVQCEDWHINTSTSVTFKVNTPPLQAVDPRRPGIRTLGSYWGGAGEQIDTSSMNLNFTVPLVAAQGRGNWSVPFNLTYNSQNWRQDSGGTWKLGYDVGYGFGWQLLAGSITPYYVSWASGVDHYVFTDATGAQYHLTTNTSGVWSSTESIYVWFDANAGVLHFRDGSFWTMACISGGTEADAGTLYPTQMEDSNGNLVLISYQPGAGMGTQANTSARISTIEDVRGKGSATYTLTYNTDPIPHLASIANSISTPETWTFTTQTYSLNSPFTPTKSYGQSVVLMSMTNTAVSTSRTFTYDTAGAGELIETTMPDGGNLQWAYTPFTYSNGRTYREVQNRYLVMSAGATALQYQFSHNDSANPSATVHANTTLQDASGAQKEWIFYTQNSPGPAAWAMGLVSTFQNHYLNGSVGARDVNYTWTTDPAGNPYITQLDTIFDDGTPNAAHMRQTQTLDKYGNVTTASTYDYNSLTTPIQTWTNTYLHSQNSTYDAAYLRNLLVSSSVTDNNGHNATTVTNTYDGTTPTAISSGTPTEWDSSNAGKGNTRGNLTQSVSFGQTSTSTYDVTGHQLTGSNSTGTGASTTYSAATNWAAPDALTPVAGTGDVQNGHTVTQASGSLLQNGYGYNSALSLVNTTMPNSATTAQNFSSSTGLLTSSTSVYGATTSYAYTFNPTIVTSTTNSHWAKSYRDGFGREIAHETGYGSTIVSHSDTLYAACACSPLGKVTGVSQPYGINGATKITSDGTGTVAWTTYAYDSLGRTLSITAADGSVTQYSYSGNITTATDPAGHWKTYTNNALGQLVSVAEPNPVYPESNSVTTYTYDIEGHLTQAYLQRPTSGAGMQTQTRQFTYDLTSGHLLSSTNPENGLMSYTYYSDGRMASKTDAKGQKVTYSYDGYGRISYIDRYPAGSQTADVCQSLTLNYDDSNTNSMGRLRSVTWGPPYKQPMSPSCGQVSMGEGYSYNAAGQLTSRGYESEFQYYCVSCNPQLYGWYIYGEDYTYDNEGTLTTYWDAMYQNNQFPANVSIYSYTLDAMERPTGLVEQDWINTNSNTIPPSGSPTSTKTWVQNVTYGPSNEMTGIQFATTAGPLYTETRSYNNLAQLTNITAAGPGLTGMNLTYTYNTGHNNGQVAIANDVLSGEQITYTYDLLNRLIQAQTTQNHTQFPNAPWWGQAYTYDGFGNLLSKTPVGPGNSTVMSLSVDPNTNHVMTSSGYGYDANGNVTTLPQSSGSLALSYDVENRFQMSGGVLMFDMENQPMYDSGTGKYSVWDPNGRRLRHETITIGVNPPAGQAIPYYAITDRNVYFGGRLIQSNSKTVLLDRLGSVRANESGDKFEYLPYGEEFTLTSQDREKFATYTRSSTNGLDYAVNRWYDSVHGDFLTPDPHATSMDLSNPATMNRYAYVHGDPINMTDPQGLDYDCGFGISGPDPSSCADPFEPGSFDSGLGSMPCSNGTMISAFEASPAEIANCQAPILGPEGPGGAPYQPPPCDVEFFTRYIFDGFVARAASLFATHQYLELTGPGAGPTAVFIEGGPTNDDSAFTNPGPLRSYVTSGAPHYPQDAGAKPWTGTTHDIPCSQEVSTIALAKGFVSGQTYDAVNGPNSNTFMAWLISQSGLSSIYKGAPPGALGWGQPFAPLAPRTGRGGIGRPIGPR
jgi:RHS repeat-associated protein